MQIIAEILGTYFVIFAGCASVTVNLSTEVITFPGICIVWGLVVMVMVYSVGHISGAHFNPAVSIAFATCGRFPWKEVCFCLSFFSFLQNFALVCLSKMDYFFFSKMKMLIVRLYLKFLNFYRKKIII